VALDRNASLEPNTSRKLVQHDSSLASGINATAHERDHLPGRAGQAPPVSQTMNQICKILSNAKKLQHQNLSLRELAGQMREKIHRDRSPTHLNRAPDLLSNFQYFEKEFKLRRYEIEDLFLQRKAAKEQGEIEQMGSQGAPSNQELRTLMGAGTIESLQYVNSGA
jgi:hypothetical protein